MGVKGGSRVVDLRLYLWDLAADLRLARFHEQESQ